jgi:hypothetical protein
MSLTMSEYDPVSAPPKGNLVLALSDAFCTYRPQRRTAADGLLGRHTASDVGGSDANHHRRATAGRDPWKRVARNPWINATKSGVGSNTHENVKRRRRGDWFILSLDAVDPLEKSGVRG